MDNLDQLFRLYHRELQKIAYHRLGDRETAADLTQDAFVRYADLDRQQRTHLIANPRFFLIRVLRNLIIDLRRTRTRRGQVGSLEDVQHEMLDPSPGPAALVELRQQLVLLHRALTELPDNARQALLLNRLDGLGHAAIAERLGVSLSMVSKYIMSALLHCARRLDLMDD
ncbi:MULTISPECIES: RNA polymerase sigma factor [unclassified Pseudomonas]|uniref:RNA polymerase sigma factor n=1 Tax=unclassified Pseudomonas TaxID=196821 RepID=UPI002114CE23|nr:MULTISPECIES: sigma-70 family RNA polymerase sigma factor [unclassified Pseudomonas]MCU1733575.1 sigma-70 family RNA polymerase sigma factor [Pseudomonas sp. 20P_3.2_Bac4]MCU1745847.1 sigma-70 family RNA polymerase sigma factor [Pseudomonas sp. 20P_3.2_Bac5]